MAGGIEIFRAAARATVAETHKALVDLAKREHSRVMAADPKPQRFSRKVDGVAGAREEAVKVGGKIEYSYSRLDAVVQAAMELLFDLSPVLSGEYRNGHTLFVGGASVQNLAGWDGVGEVVITNMLPYSRKIEIGKMKMRVPDTDHVYQQAEFMLRQRFGNQARIKFNFRGIVAGAMPDPISFPSSLRRRAVNGRFMASGGHAHNKSGNRFPALEIGAM